MLAVSVALGLIRLFLDLGLVSSGGDEDDIGEFESESGEASTATRPINL